MEDVPQVTEKETTEILRVLEECLGVPGEVVELGCYKGETSVRMGRVLAEWARAGNGRKELWLYDSFAGLPEKSAEDTSAAGEQFRGGELLASKREVIEKFKKAGLVLPRVKKAFFEELTPGDLPEEVAFAFLDGDLYQSIKVSFELLEGKMAPEAVIVVHDYNNLQLPGVTRAVDEWLRVHPGVRLEWRESLAVLRLE